VTVSGGSTDGPVTFPLTFACRVLHHTKRIKQMECFVYDAGRCKVETCCGADPAASLSSPAVHILLPRPLQIQEYHSRKNCMTVRCALHLPQMYH
jgi:hypothetical protein